jgi:hypothetical protein
MTFEDRAAAQKNAYKEMHDTLDAADYVSDHMKGVLNTLSEAPTPAQYEDDIQNHMSSDMEMLFRSSREHMQQELRDQRELSEYNAVIRSRAESFAAIARKHGFAIDPNSL